MICRRFESEGFARLERGEALPSHFDSCPDCLAARAEHDRIVSGFVALRSETEPLQGWQDSVWEGIEARSPSGLGLPGRRLPRLRLVIPALATVLLVAILVPISRISPRASLKTTVLAGDELRRGLEATVGDRLRIESSAPKGANSEIRLYFNESELVLRCVGSEPCRSTGVKHRAEVTLERRGSYRALLVTSSSAIPPPRGNLDQDAGEALSAGADVLVGEEFQIR